MINTAESAASHGTWVRRPGATIHQNAKGNADLTVEFTHDSETGVPTVRMHGSAAVNFFMNARKMPNPTEAQLRAVTDSLAELEEMDEDDSTDDELEALKSTLDQALALLGLTRGQ